MIAKPHYDRNGMEVLNSIGAITVSPVRPWKACKTFVHAWSSKLNDASDSPVVTVAPYPTAGGQVLFASKNARSVDIAQPSA